MKHLKREQKSCRTLLYQVPLVTLVLQKKIKIVPNEIKNCVLKIETVSSTNSNWIKAEIKTNNEVLVTFAPDDNQLGEQIGEIFIDVIFDRKYKLSVGFLAKVEAKK